MLEPIRHILSKQRNILASGSPRRRELLELIGLKAEVISSGFDENLDKESFSHPCEYVKENAKQKAVDVWKRLVDSNDQADLVIGADTVVTLDDVVYEKPIDTQDACRILSKLSGQKHTVFTGVALVTPNPQSTSDSRGGDASSLTGTDYLVTTFHEATDVVMTECTEAIIKSYVDTGEPMDKAGAYGIQGLGGTLVEGVRGCYFNVIGLPLHRLSKELFHMYSEK